MDPHNIIEWIVNEIAVFGVRWVVYGILLLGISRFFGSRYLKMKDRITKLEAAVSGDQGTTVIHNNVNVASDPPDMGDVNEIRAMTQAEYDALPIKKESTLYLIKKET